ncbi:myelin and lymphocyte protein-like [Brachyhypopomus gauderio]|uniref:myelin and lymphocyte protein-like n=1 Tax=Brachyhypopomus gauderio TaxID=698409 RepID=UPI00404249A6
MASDGRHLGRLPSGMGICCSIPDLLFLPELVFGGLVWILIACTYIDPANPQAYVMAVSLLCFICTFLWMIIFTCGCHNNRNSWATVDVLYHFLASVLYLSASVPLAMVTLDNSYFTNSTEFKTYRFNISSVVFSYLATLLYVIHTVFSAIRWKSF